MLEVVDLHAHYGKSHILQGISLRVEPGEVVSLLGRNGAGKTTTIRALMGQVRSTGGRVHLRGTEITTLPPYRRHALGLRLVPQGREVFGPLTVHENLQLGTVTGGQGGYTIDDAYRQFPRLQEKMRIPAGQLSGGEQQMLVVARALLGQPGLILMDEPSEGLAPKIVIEIRQLIRQIAAQGMPVLLAEQNVGMALKGADRHYLIDKGQVVFSGSTQELEQRPELMHQILGVDLHDHHLTTVNHL